VRFAPILLKKSKISPRQNSRKSELIAEFGWRCLLKHLRRRLVEFAPVEAVPHVPKRQAHQRFLENWSRRRIGLFQQNLPEAVIRAWPSSIIGVAANSQKHAPTMSPRMKLNLAIEEHFTPGAAPVAHHNPNNDCL